MKRRKWDAKTKAPIVFEGLKGKLMRQERKKKRGLTPFRRTG